MFRGFSKLGLLGFALGSVSATMESLKISNADMGLRVSQDLRYHFEKVCLFISVIDVDYIVHSLLP
ncbi:hypothetical protein SLEP1_g8699 [Rubroshorea leprosula]|uniref:Uncharacterized protein n=1 Tax=Rubroshorea leprosula TaxID=152421 RepID=A0AAV5I2K7_9ROSI|nr:hypothetical protein SLEP1_g8699 [Rubroshorea leprosula]